jgi:hypothetical protein
VRDRRGGDRGKGVGGDKKLKWDRVVGMKERDKER